MPHGLPRPRPLPLFILLLLALPGAAVPARARACSCATQTREQAFESAAAVFEGRVLEIERAKPSEEDARVRLLVTLQVVRAWKGVETERVTVQTAGDEAACGFSFKPGESYLVYASRAGSHMAVSLCSRTRPVTEAAEDIDAMGLGEVPVQPVLTSEEKRAFSPDARPEPRPAGCASCTIASPGSGTAGWASGLLVALWLAARRRRV